MIRLGIRCFSTLLLILTPFLSGAQVNADGNMASGTDRDASVDLIESNLKGYFSQVFDVNALTINDITLYNALESWLGTPYRYAGKSKSGIDCSGFVSTIYKDAFCTDLTGGSSEMYRKVELIGKNELREGDLVFFRIRKGISHVGIYLGDNKFIHASRSSGVIVSNLESPYYKRYFAKGGRIVTDNN